MRRFNSVNFGVDSGNWDNQRAIVEQIPDHGVLCRAVNQNIASMQLVACLCMTYLFFPWRIAV